MSCGNGEEWDEPAHTPSIDAMMNELAVRDVLIPANQDVDIQAPMVIADDHTETNKTSISGRVVDASKNSTLPPVNAALRQQTNKTTEPSSATGNMSEFSSSSLVVRTDECEQAMHKIPRTQGQSDQNKQLAVMDHLTEWKTPATMENLPAHIVLEILYHSTLNELTEVIPNVCTRWRELAHYPILWRNKQFCVDNSLTDDEVIYFLKQWPELCHIVFKRSVKQTVIHALCDYSSMLRKLKIDPSQIMNFGLMEKLVQKCSGIKSLSIPGRFMGGKVFAHILARLHQLEYLEITQNIGIKMPISLVPLAYGCPKLTRLKVLPSTHVRLADFEQFVNLHYKIFTQATLPWIIYGRSCVVPLLRDCTSLISLELSNCSMSATDDEPAEIFNVLSQMFNLRSLTINYLNGCPPGVAACAFNTGGLANLHLLDFHNSYLENKTVMAICKGCPKLRTLRLNSSKLLSDKGLRMLHLLTELEWLDLSLCKYLGGEAMKYVAQVPKLRKLLLNWIDLEKLQPGLEHIELMSSLEILSLSHTKNTSSFPFDRIPVNLRVLNVKTYLDGRNILQMLKDQMPALKLIEPNYDHPENPLLSDSDIARLMEL